MAMFVVKLMYVSSPDVQIWDLRNLVRRHILTDHSDSVTCLAMGNDFM